MLLQDFHIRRACEHCISQHFNDPLYIPRWERDTGNPSGQQTPCAIEGCDMQGAIRGSGKPCIPSGLQIRSTTTDIIFCPYHYHLTYRHTHAKTVECCKTCKAKPKRGETYSRHCPNPPVVEKYLQVIKGFPETVTSSDVVCYECYRKFSELVFTLNLFNAPINDESDPTVNGISTDAELDTLLQGLHSRLLTVPEGSEEYAVVASALLTGQVIRKQQGVLLPSVFKYFLAKHSTTTLSAKSRNSRWLLKQLEQLLDHHIMSACKQRKYGTVIIYRNGGDLLHALSVALGSHETQGSEIEREDHYERRLELSNDLEQLVGHVGEILNEKLHELTSNLVEEDKRTPYDYRNVDIDQFLQSVDPLLWKLLTLLTRSKNEKKGRTPQGPSLNTTIKKLRQFYCLCILMFTTNNRCYMPIHLLLTDTVKRCGGSSELVKIRNRLCIVASESAHSRLVTYVAEQREKEFQHEVTQNAFCLASADNIDNKSSYAAAYAGKASNIWHGTSIQCVEPRPNSLHISSSVMPESPITRGPSSMKYQWIWTHSLY